MNDLWRAVSHRVPCRRGRLIICMARANEPTRNRNLHSDNISVDALCMLARMPRACACSFVLVLMFMSVLTTLVCEVMLIDVYGRCLARGRQVGHLFSFGFLDEVSVGSGHTLPVVGVSDNCFRMGSPMRRLLGRATRRPWSAGRKTVFV